MFQGSKDVDIVWGDESLCRIFFHSHNTLIEIFSALGFAGVLIQSIKVYFISKALKPSYQYFGGIFMITFWLLTSFWFELTATVPYSLLAFVLITQRTYPTFSFLKKNSLRTLPLIRGLMGGCAFLLLAPIIPVALTTHNAIQADRITMTPSYEKKIQEVTANTWIHLDHYFGFQRSSEMLRNLSSRSFKIMEKRGLSPQDVYKGNREIARYLFNRRLGCGNLFALMTPLNLYGELATHKLTKVLFNEDKNALKDWMETCTAFIKCAPKRSDMLIPLLNRLVLESKINQAQQLVVITLRKNPKDPVGLWFSGILKMNSPSTFQEGYQNLKEAYKLGINRFMPIPEDLISKLK